MEEIVWGERKECKESPGPSLRNTMVLKSGRELVIKGHRKGGAAGQEGKPECVGHRSQRNRGFKKAEMLTHCWTLSGSVHFYKEETITTHLLCPGFSVSSAVVKPWRHAATHSSEGVPSGLMAISHGNHLLLSEDTRERTGLENGQNPWGTPVGWAAVTQSRSCSRSTEHAPYCNQPVRSIIHWDSRCQKRDTFLAKLKLYAYSWSVHLGGLNSIGASQSLLFI